MGVSVAAVSRAIGPSPTRWLEAIAVHTTRRRPDLREGLTQVLGVEPVGEDVLSGLSIGEIGVCYEALLAQTDAGSRRSVGQYFTPDDVAEFMADQTRSFPDGTWLDPCCGVGNLSWYVAQVQENPESFVGKLILIDRDEVALRTAVALIGSSFLSDGNVPGLTALFHRAVCRDFLELDVPDHDFAIANPPYARAAARDDLYTGSTRDLFGYFLEKIAYSSAGFVVVTPASYLSVAKFQVLRDLLEAQMSGGDVFVFDNVPDTLFRGYKFGSTNTSTTNFVRAAITVCSPDRSQWQVTPILRWRAASRARMLATCEDLLVSRRIGPHGEWVKLLPELQEVWHRLEKEPVRLADLLVRGPTDYSLTVATTPRYYISATYRDLRRSSKAVLYFATEDDRDRAAIVLNSSLPYLWWRALDGGVTLPRRVLRTVPMPEVSTESVDKLKNEEPFLVTKRNAGKVNENVKRPPELVAELDAIVLPDVPDLGRLYTKDMFRSRPL